MGDRTGSGAPRVEEYEFGRIVIDGETYTNDVIITPESVRPEWWREEGHSLSMKDLGDLLNEPPEVLIIGIGANGVMSVPEDVAEAIRDLGVELVVEKTGRAVEIYNERAPRGGVAAGLHLTC